MPARPTYTNGPPGNGVIASSNRAMSCTLTALPLSLAVALLLLWASGLSVNVMTLGGLAVAIGELVLGDLGKGQWRTLTDAEVAALSRR